MKDIGFLFPGQGAQIVGMGRDFYEQSKPARDIFDQADQILGFSVSDLCFAGPETELTRTINTQVAIFVTSIAMLRALQTSYPQLKPALACGLSLGEFTALTALNAISFEDGLRLVRRRGELMEEAGQINPGTMASIIGLSPEACQSVCAESGAVVANLNSPEQIAISGTAEAIEKACQLAQTKGAKRALVLKVGGAFHSPLMKHAEAGLKEALSKIEIKRPEAKFIPNATAELVSDPEEIRSLLAKQLTNPVQWIKSINIAAQNGIKEFLEIGPGKVLKGLARRINPDVTIYNIEKFENIESIKTALTEKINVA